MRLLYTALLYLITPIVIGRLLWRSRSIRGYRQRIPERFGLVANPPSGIAVWVHAVSVGEALAALPMIRELIAEHGEQRVWVTSTTPTGSERVIAALGSQVMHSYAPYDLPGAVSRFLDRIRPERVVVIETELWPNLFDALHKKQIPLLIANARLSPRSFRGYSRVGGFARSVLSNTSLVAAQSTADAERFSQLGAPRVVTTGNIKFDVEPPSEQIAAGTRLRENIGLQRPVWIAASTHEGEESGALDAHAHVINHFPDALLILVPRHPQRFESVAREVRDSGLRFSMRSNLPGSLDDIQVLLGDSLGEMWMYLQAGDVVFVGGSLVEVGGHNVLEPAALSRAVIFGPHMHNFLSAKDLLLQTQSALQVADAKGLSRVLIELLSDPHRSQQMGQMACDAVLGNRGALAKLMIQIRSL